MFVLASQTYQLAALSLVSTISQQDTFFNNVDQSTIITLHSLCDEINRSLPAEFVSDVVEDIISLSFHANQQVEFDHLYQTFMVDVISSSSLSGIQSNQLNILKESLSNKAVAVVSEAPLRIKLAHSEIMAKHYGVALNLIQPLFHKNVESLISDDASNLRLSMDEQLIRSSFLTALSKHGITNWPANEDYWNLYPAPQAFLVASRRILLNEGDLQWVTEMLNACFSWLEADSYSHENAAEFLLVLIHELYSTNHNKLAHNTQLRFIDWLERQQRLPHELERTLYKHTAKIGLQHAANLPLKFVQKSIRLNVLDFNDEVALLANIAESDDDNFAIAIEEFGDVYQKGLSFLEEFNRLSEIHAIPVDSSIQQRIVDLEEAAGFLLQ